MAIACRNVTHAVDLIDCVSAGIATLQKMAGKDVAAAKSVMENFEMEAPYKSGDSTWLVRYALKRGIFKVKITNTFTMELNLIRSLQVTRS